MHADELGRAARDALAGTRFADVRWVEETGSTNADALELAECLRFVADEPGLAADLAAPGRDYVLDHYGWDAALDRFEATIEAWT